MPILAQGKRGRRRKEELERMGEAERKREESIKMQRNRLSARECRKRKKYATPVDVPCVCGPCLAPC